MGGFCSACSRDAAALSLGTRRLRVIHFNDVYNLHPTSEDKDAVGGASRFASALAELRKQEPPPLIVFAGDLLGPSMVSAVTKGRHMVQALDMLGVDFGCFGNHEFDFGVAGLNKILHTPISKYGITTEPSKVRWLSTNFDGANGRPVGGAAVSALIDWHGVKVGLVSVSENWLPGCNRLKKGDVVYRDDIAACREECQKLRAEGAEVTLALTHSSIEHDRKLMTRVPREELDLLCGGHDHDYIRNEELRIVKAGQEFRWLADIEFQLSIDRPAKLTRCKQVPISTDFPLDPTMEALVEKWEGMVAAKAAKVIGRSAVDLQSTYECLRFKEGALSNFICDCIAADYSADQGLQLADFAMLMGITITGKCVTPAGEINVGHLMKWFPKLEVIEVLELTGGEVIKSLERGCKSLPKECGAIHHVSSAVAYSINVSEAKGEGRVHSVLVNGAPIDLAHTYKVAVTATMGAGKYGYDWMGTAPRVVEEELGTPIVDLVRAWFKTHKGEAVNPSMGRITIQSP